MVTKRKAPGESTTRVGGLSKRRSVTQERIVSSALRLFREHGFCRVGVDKVCSLAGISKKTFYQYFTAKDVLVEAVVEEVREQVRQATSMLGGAPDDPLEKLLTLQRALAVRLPQLVSVPLMRDLKARRPELWDLIDARRREILPQIELVIIDGQRRGIFRREVNPRLVTLMVLGSIVEIIRPETLVNSPFSLDEALNGTFEFFLRGLVADPRRLGRRLQKKKRGKRG